MLSSQIISSTILIVTVDAYLSDATEVNVFSRSILSSFILDERLALSPETPWVVMIYPTYFKRGRFKIEDISSPSRNPKALPFLQGIYGAVFQQENARSNVA
ncbi:hypothetical protein TNCV_4971981 [Trichonephila clavipes]|nr:hypothetical protein TNCV_4971981 [Trichonephila clavipes]